MKKEYMPKPDSIHAACDSALWTQKNAVGARDPTDQNTVNPFLLNQNGGTPQQSSPVPVQTKDSGQSNKQ